MAVEATVRRSSRDRRQVTTFYDDAKQELEERRSLSPAKKGCVSYGGVRGGRFWIAPVYRFFLKLLSLVLIHSLLVFPFTHGFYNLLD